MNSGSQILNLLFPELLYRTASKAVHLTFDDGPHPVSTPNILNILQKKGVPATFFLMGKNIAKYPDLARRIRSEGHQIGNHSYTHDNLLFSTYKTIRNDILKTEEILNSLDISRSLYFRPPYGYFNFSVLKVLKEIGMSCMLWSVDSKDFQPSSCPDYIVKRVVRRSTYGSVLLLHDNDSVAQKNIEYLPVLIDKLSENDLAFETLPS